MSWLHHSRAFALHKRGEKPTLAHIVPSGEPALASLGLNIEEQKAIDRFRKEVVEPSMTSLVILDFWAEW